MATARCGRVRAASRTPIRWSVAAVVGLALLAGCSNENSPAADAPHNGTGTATAGADGVQRIVVDTGGDLRFHPSTLVVHTGRVRLTLVNQRQAGSGSPPHDLKVYGLPGATTPYVQAGQRTTITFTAGSPGRYRFVCLLHVQQGQTGTLIVRRGG